MSEMIDWATAGALLADLLDHRGQAADEARRLQRDAPVFQNKDFPVTALPVAVSAEAVEAHRETVERYVALLEKVLDLYRDEPAARPYFDLEPAEGEIALAEAGYRPRIRILRLDGYLAQESGAVVFLENNTDCPAGTLFTERINRLVDRLVEGRLPRAGATLQPTELDRGDAARQALLAAYREFGGAADTPTLAVLQIRGRSNAESLEMAEEYTARGTPTFVADPREVALGPDGVTVEGRRVDLVWNKVNTVYWKPLCEEDPALLPRWAEVIASGKLCHVNPFSARYVTESKLCAGFVQEEDHRRWFTDEERELAARVLPWSRKLAPGKEATWRGETWDLQELLRARQADFVLKQHYDIRGDGVTIGRSVPREVWEQTVAAGLEGGYTAQEFIPGRTYPILMDTAAGEVIPMTTSLDSFVFGGRLVGLGSKAGLGTKVNVFQGGRKLAVRVYGRP